MADNGWEGPILSFVWENDALSGTDRHYTEGARIAFLSNDNSLPRWTQKLSELIPALGLDIQAQKWGLAFGQEIYTPEDHQTRTVVADDRPYAAWLFGSLSLQRRGMGFRPLREDIRLDLGVVGPEALGEEAQKALHHDLPQGWPNQLHAEPGLALRYKREYLFAGRTADRSWGYDFIPYGGGSLGNVATYLNVGTVLRVGYNVPNEFEAPPERTACRFGAYLFAGVEGRWVIHNIFLDGNTFRPSHGVDRIPLVGDWKVGGTVVLKTVELTAAYIFRSREFEGQKDSDSFGSAMITVKF